jgi:putative phage-type endonuclease
MKQRTEEWFKARRGRITASMVGAILGHAPYLTRDGAMRRMVRDWHGAPSEFEGNVATHHGTFHEDGARAEYEMETGCVVDDEGFCTRDEWAGCSPDGLIGLVGGLEIKCPFSKRKMGPGETFKPLAEQPHYVDQVQFSMWVAQRAWWDFYQWSPSGKTMLERVDPDSAWRSRNLPKLKEFWDEYLEERQQDNATRHLEPLKAEIDTPDAQRLMAEYDDLQEAIERAKERLEEVEDQLVGMCAGKSAIVAGRNVTRVERAGSVSYAKALKAYAPSADLEPYRGKPSVSWMIG